MAGSDDGNRRGQCPLIVDMRNPICTWWLARHVGQLSTVVVRPKRPFGVDIMLDISTLMSLGLRGLLGES